MKIKDIIKEIGCEEESWSVIEVNPHSRLPQSMDEFAAAYNAPAYNKEGFFAEDTRPGDWDIDIAGDYTAIEVSFDEFDKFFCDGCAPDDFREICPMTIIAIPEQSKEEENESIKYELYTDTFELRFGRTMESIPAMSASDIQEAYEAQTANDPHLVATFDTKEEAKAALAEMSASTYPQASNVFWLLVGNVAWIEENAYDADGEFDSNVSWVDFIAEPYTPEEEDEDK